MNEIEIEKEQTISELIDELQLSNLSILLGVNGQILNPIETKDRKLKKEDKVLVIPFFDSG